MKFSAREDINAPIEQVFEMLTDFRAYERSARQRGAEVQRIDQLIEPDIGMMWKATFVMRGKPRKLDITLTEYDRPNAMVFSTVSKGLTGQLSMELMAMSRARTRVSVALDLKPQNLSARLMIQSLRLAKSKLNKRFKQRVAELSKDAEKRLGSMV
ncbi:MAG: SRPBCC family protein [Paracoccaceae bacterium]